MARTEALIQPATLSNNKWAASYREAGTGDIVSRTFASIEQAWAWLNGAESVAA